MSEIAQHRIETAHVRRSPRYAIFIVVGAALGILAALVLTFAFGDGDATSSSTNVTYSASQVFGFVCLVCIPAGIAVGAVVALLLDRRFSRRTRAVRIDHERVDPSTSSGTD